ncbi:MAG: family 31 glucosidase, partial [Lactobacillus crispatus]|nr:family 31 glucosidase [Lactobacillus crispatus]
CHLELAQRNSQTTIPFYLSNKGYGFLWNNPGIGEVTFANNITEWKMVDTDCIDYWICAEETPKKILSAYADVTGHVPDMPKFALGLWQSKLRYRTQEEVLNVAHKYYDLGIQLSFIVIDYFHWTYQGDFKFDSRYFPDPKKMVDELNDLGIKLMVSVWPNIDQKSENYQEMSCKNYLV